MKKTLPAILAAVLIFAGAVSLAEVYQCPDPYAVAEMEDVAVARAVERMGIDQILSGQFH